MLLLLVMVKLVKNFVVWLEVVGLEFVVTLLVTLLVLLIFESPTLPRNENSFTAEATDEDAVKRFKAMEENDRRMKGRQK